MVLHTLVIDPRCKGSGLGREFEAYYERYALSHGCRALRIDTNARNTVAQSFYRKLGYREIAVVPVTFNGIPGVDLVLLKSTLAKRKPPRSLAASGRFLCQRSTFSKVFTQFR